MDVADMKKKRRGVGIRMGIRALRRFFGGGMRGLFFEGVAGGIEADDVAEGV